MTLLEDTIYPKHMVEDLVVEDERNVQFLLVEHLEPSLDVIPELLPAHRKVVLGQPVAVQNRPLESNLGHTGWLM